MVRKKRTARRFFLGVLVLLLVILGAAVWFVSPAQSLDMQYRSIDFKDKLLTMLEKREPRMTLSTEELGQLSKKNMVEYLHSHDLGVEVTGAEFIMNGTRMTANINGQWGLIPFGASLGFQMSVEGSQLQLAHQSTTIRGFPIEASLFQLEPIVISLKDYLPDLVTIRDVKFLSDGLELHFKVDWMAIPSLLK
ncbi:hypothetical protein JCM10914A_12210 [Paenibacillus sp. JCM 10914]|uniref:hypothetical protein n=1 Tax=Paenibacillus sp. JCM 10914 TaxID=1236974 RepID=UPI0003CC49C2|nr:hypothetical protein [Paenibacillus sp. JCM 10914]GAE09395.1 hypothetical protein JCM10914_5754 [Paenibacillus sp. JCM 10914]